MKYQTNESKSAVANRRQILKKVKKKVMYAVDLLDILTKRGGYIEPTA